jgi:hypothetical protein
MIYAGADAGRALGELTSLEGSIANILRVGGIVRQHCML